MTGKKTDVTNNGSGEAAVLPVITRATRIDNVLLVLGLLD
jgi:hypothetical protein